MVAHETASVDDCEPIERLAAADGNERWLARHRVLGIDLDLRRWRLPAAERARARLWLERRARLAHPHLAPLIGHGEDEAGCWAATEAGDAWRADGTGWRATLEGLAALAEAAAFLHRAGLAQGDIAGSGVRDDDGRVRLGMPPALPDAKHDARADLVALTAGARAALAGDGGETWFLPAPVRALVDASHGDAIEFAAAAARALVTPPADPARRLTVLAYPDQRGVTVLCEDGAGEAATRIVAHDVVAQFFAEHDLARRSRPASAEARAAGATSDPIAALASRFAAAVLPENALARLWQPDWRIEIGDAGSSLPWRLLGGAAMAMRDDLRLSFGESVDVGAIAPVAAVLIDGTSAHAGASARAAARALGRFPWWRRRAAPAHGPLVIAGDLAGARALLARDPTLVERVALAVLSGIGQPLPLASAAAQLLIDPLVPASLGRAVADACWRSFAAGEPAHAAAHAGDRLLATRSAPCDPLCCGIMLHGNGDLRLARGRLPLVGG
ncbi:MAG TPA: hypothetical protein VEL07_08405 [Planctomycetota bacterium]|nr:hypothetical protein [Planctomycetota bacterium]